MGIQMKKIVCNTSPIIALSKIGYLEILNKLFDKVYISNAVYEETVKDQDFERYGCRELLRLLESSVFQRYEVENSAIVNKMYGLLHAGEIEVMVAAKELEIERVILDDNGARKTARSMMLKPIGTVGILIIGKESGFIEQVKPLLDQLIDVNFYLSKQFYTKVLQDVGEI
jgi:predicted nucleic acid-binding protein